MYVLAIETTGAFASVALMKDNEIIGHVQGHDRFSHLQNLMPQVAEVLEACQSSLGDIDVIAVSRGPGSFTGIRIGVSSVRALSQVSGIPCVGVSSLEALAMRAAGKVAGEGAGEGACEAELICPMLDARRSQVYAGGYLIEDGYPKEVIAAGAYTLEEFMDKVNEYDSIIALGDGVDAYSQKIDEIRPNGVKIVEETIRYQDGQTVAMLGSKIYRETGGLNYQELKPDYMRLAEAERKLREKKG